MSEKALFDYGVMVGALEYVEKAIMVTENTGWEAFRSKAGLRLSA
jgi:hypothetical protein